MTFFVDANVVIYAAVDSEYRDACAEVLEAIVDGADGRTSAAVLEEVWHIERSGRLGDLDGLAERAYTLLSPLLPVTDDAFSHALRVDGLGIGTNDRVHVGTCIVHEIDTIVTADQGFDTAREIKRVDPLDARALRRLLRRA
jgi:predicted nucleic acid-binding protein